MYNWVVRRTIERTAGPQPVYTTIVDQTVLKWIPATALLLSSFATPAAAKLDVRRYDWAPAFSWVQPVVDAQVRTWVAPAAAEAASFRTGPGPTLDVRRFEWASSFISTAPIVDTTVRTWAPVFGSELASARTRDGGRLDVRAFAWSPDPAPWIIGEVAPGATVAQTWPAVLSGLGTNYRTRAGAVLDVRSYEWDSDGPTAPAVDATVRTWLPAFSAELASARTADGVRLDVRLPSWSPDAATWITPNLPPSLTTARTWPAILAGAGTQYRSGDRDRLDVRRFEWSPVFSWVRPVVDAQVASLAGIAVSQAAGVRTSASPTLDVRTYAWSPDAASWISATLAPAATVAQQWPAILEGLGLSYRTSPRPTLDVRSYSWSPDSGWTFNAVSPAATVPQQWPAVLEGLGLSYRSAERARLDVRRYEWAPAFSWPQPVVDRQVAARAGLIASELASFRTTTRPPLDVRAFRWAPDSAWMFYTAQNQALPRVLTTAVTSLVASRSVVSLAGARSVALDLTTYAEAVLAAGPDGYWRLGDALGSLAAVDASGHGNTGTVVGGVTFQRAAALQDGDTAALFNGTSGFISTPAAIPSHATIEALVNPSGTGFFLRIFSSGGNFPFELATNDVATIGGTLHFFVTFTTLAPGWIDTGATLPSGVWTHVAMTWDGTTLRVYKNGLQVYSNATWAGRVLQSGTAMIGGLAGSSWWPGLLDEVALYPIAVDAGEIARHAALVLPLLSRGGDARTVTDATDARSVTDATATRSVRRV